MFDKKFGLKIKALRENISLTQGELGKFVFPESENHQSMIWKIENGERKTTFEEAIKLADFFNQKIEDLNPSNILQIKRNQEDELFWKIKVIFRNNREGVKNIFKNIIEEFYKFYQKDMRKKEKKTIGRK
ncbi:MAG: helix-turn-helix domain-containing protein [Nanoarchaeota archaeon]|nr:helix-turn-helix domain-containing protein [Nanoarchaeota archaeon]